MKRRAFIYTSALATAGGLASTASAKAPAKIRPGCFPAKPFKSSFPNPQTDPNAVLAVGTWHLIVNGRILEFRVDSVSSKGVVAHLSSGETLNVSWDPAAKKLQFTRRLPYEGGTTDQDFVGYLMSVNPDDTKLRIAGYATREPTTNYDHPSRLTYGFYMTIDR